MSVKPKGIILLEGADAAGKTTLANYFRANYGARYIHGTLYKDPWKWHVAAIRRAGRLAQEQLVVIDRNWLSHLVYGEVYNNKQYDIGARCLDRMLRRFGAVTVLCAPRDQEAQVKRWHDGRAAGKREHFNSVREVIALYTDLRDGNLARPGEGYLGQLTRFGDFQARDDVLVYDIDRDGQDLARYSKSVLTRLRRLSKAVVPYRGDNLAGRVSGTGTGILFVGVNGATAKPYWPWCGRDSSMGSKTLLNTVIHELALREDRLEFTDPWQRHDDYDYLPTLLCRAKEMGQKVICLGDIARDRVVDEFDIDANCIPYPTKHNFSKYDYKQLLGEALQ